MARLARLDEGLFPVGWQPLHVRIDGRNMNVTGHEVSVHQKGRIAGVISHVDRLFPREQALGGACYRALTVIVQTMRGMLPSLTLMRSQLRTPALSICTTLCHLTYGACPMTPVAMRPARSHGSPAAATAAGRRPGTSAGRHAQGA
jgi:hypothetical protein